MITHGWIGNETYPAWVNTMAQALTTVAQGQNLQTTRYHIRIFKGSSGITSSIERIPAATTPPEGEIVVTVDWANLGNHLHNGAGITTDQVANELQMVLRRATPSIGLSSPLASLPLHLIGHSRGGSVMLETAHYLGKCGVWVDHLTSLDPHPLMPPDIDIFPNGFQPPDQPLRLYENVVFADNYWRKDTLADDIWVGNLDFNGHSIPGSTDYFLSETILGGVGSSVEHSDVHSWYHGTIGSPGQYPTSDGDVSITADWYASTNHRNARGFAYSRLFPGGLNNRRIIRFANARSHGGTADRLSTDRGGGSQWANIEYIQTPGYPNNRIPQGQTTSAAYKYQDRDSSVWIDWFVDSDTNPFNNVGSPIASQTLGSTGDKVNDGNVGISTSGMSVGITRRLLAKITSLDNIGVRYEYADNPFTITPSDFALQSVSPSQVNGGVGQTSLTLLGNGFGATDKVLFSNGTTITPVTPSSVSSNQILVNFDFGSTLRSWDISVQQYNSGVSSRASESLNVEVTSSAPAGPAITQQPTDATIIFGQTNTFVVSSTGSGTLSYQWIRNNLPIAGATGSS